LCGWLIIFCKAGKKEYNQNYIDALLFHINPFLRNPGFQNKKGTAQQFPFYQL
jgi:hypothetical protein